MKFLGVIAFAICTTAGLASQIEAQNFDVDTLIEQIDTRSGQYDKLVEILQGPDSDRALNAFDVMLATGDPTLIEVAITTGFIATDSRLRGRALWETLSRKDAFTIVVDQSGLDEEEKANLEGWYGAVQTWPLYEKVPDTQCINLESEDDGCRAEKNLSISGVRVDIIYSYSTSGISGFFALNKEGSLVGQVMDRRTKAVYPARINIR